MSDSDNEWVIVDLETLDIIESAAIVSIGILYCDFKEPLSIEEYMKNGIHCKFDYNDQIKNHNRTYSKDVLSWWKDQSGFAKKILTVDEKSHKINELPKIINFFKDKFKVSNGAKWACRGFFDINMIGHVYRSLGYTTDDYPWKYYNTRELRTMHECLSGIIRPLESDSDALVKHNALHDCIIEAIHLQEAFTELEIM